MSKVLYVENSTLYYITGVGYTKSQLTYSSALASISDVISSGSSKDIVINSYDNSTGVMSIGSRVRGCGEILLNIKLASNNLVVLD